MINMKKVSFDPGFAPLVIDSIGQVGYTYYIFSAIPDLKLKRLNFPNVFRKIEKLLKINVSFYLGCLLWASVISKVEDAQIEGNKLLGEDAKEEEYTREIDFLIDFAAHDLPRDCKYYQNKIYEPDEKILSVLKAYREFLVINKGFVECANTNQILLPKNLKILDEKGQKIVREAIENAIEKKDLTLLFENFDLIF